MRRIAAAIALLAATVTFAVADDREPSHALGPVVAITPFEVDTDGGLCCVGDVELSGRGEVGGVREDEVQDVAFVQFDVGGPEPLEDGDGIGVSGDGCTAVIVVNALLRVVDRCAETDRTMGEVPGNPSRVDVAVTFDGAFAALHYTVCGAACFNVVDQFDTATGDRIGMPGAAAWIVADPGLGVDIDDSGQVIVATVMTEASSAVVRWRVLDGAVDLLTDLADDSGYPSVSGDGELVSFSSNRARGLGEASTGPWVYVVPAGGGAGVLASSPDEIAYHSSLSRDGTQVAYTVSNGYDPPQVGFAAAPRQQAPTCADVFAAFLTTYCPPARIDVAFAPRRGVTGGIQRETVSLDAAGAVSGSHWLPTLSGNGRWIAWISSSGDGLMGQDFDLAGNSHAFMRRRDTGLVVDDVNFGTITVNAVTSATTTVRNTGRTSVWIGQISPSPAAFGVTGGTCALGISLGPGATCTVDVRYSPGASPGTSNGTLTVGEVGYDALSAAGTLSGTATVPPTTPTTTSTTLAGTTTTTTTTVPGQVTTTTRPGTPTTLPGTPTLSATPDPVEFGSVAVGFASDPRNVTVRNNGTGGGLIQTSLGGAHPDDFWVRTNGCVGITLTVGGDCQIEVLLIPRGGGSRTATLTIRSGTAVETVTLNGNGTFQPRLVPMPAAVTEHGISTIYGQGFPPGETFTVTVVETGLTLQGTADVTGLFRAYLPAAGNLSLGKYTLNVDGVPNTFEAVEANLLVALGTFRPQGEGGPAFGNTNLIVARGG